MQIRLPLSGVRFHLSASVPDDFPRKDDLLAFVKSFVRLALAEGGNVVHGSHPTIVDTVVAAAKEFGGARDAVTLVRARKYAIEESHLAEMKSQKESCLVEVIPADPVDQNLSLVPMREWMASRTDVVVAVGGKWWDKNRPRAGVPAELEESLKRGHPGFAVAGFGGAIQGYVNDIDGVFSRLKNGLSRQDNQALAAETDGDIIARKIIEQAKLLPLVRENVSSGRKFRILCLDGGGLRGTFTAAVLSRWAQMMGSPDPTDLVRHFDIVAGTSTGAILAVGLGLGLSPDQILQFYRRKGPEIFDYARLKGSKYDANKLQAALKDVLGSRLISESICRLVIPTIRAANGKAEVITTPHHKHRTADQHRMAVDATLASSSAPTYFDEAVIEDEISTKSYIDGGIWANNPVLAALAEAVGPLEQPIDRIDVLSVGTLESEADFLKTLGGGQVRWGLRLVDLLFASQESGAEMLADRLLGRSRHLRVNRQTSTEIAMDNTGAIEQMATRGDEAGRDTFELVQSRFLDGYHAEPWDE